MATRWFGARVLVLETVGRHVRASPAQRRSCTCPTGDDLVVVPANAGAARPPAWWLNLRARRRGHRARLRRAPPRAAASKPAVRERERLWRRFAAVTPVTHYERAAGRELPVVVLRRALA